MFMIFRSQPLGHIPLSNRAAFELGKLHLDGGSENSGQLRQRFLWSKRYSLLRFHASLRIHAHPSRTDF